MTSDDARLDVASGDREVRLPEIPGIIDGWMGVYPEAGGNVSFRVVIGISDGHTSRRDLVELIISAGHAEDLACALTQHRAGLISDADPMSSFPCHIGFFPNATMSAA